MDSGKAITIKAAWIPGGGKNNDFLIKMGISETYVVFLGKYIEMGNKCKVKGLKADSLKAKCIGNECDVTGIYPLKVLDF